MKQVKALSIRCDECGKLYQIPLSPNKPRADAEIAFASCPHCRAARDAQVLLIYWGKPRCWGCQVPFEVAREEAYGLCVACYMAKWRQAKALKIDLPPF